MFGERPQPPSAVAMRWQSRILDAPGLAVGERGVPAARDACRRIWKSHGLTRAESRRAETRDDGRPQRDC